ncbi:6-phospho-3-hexuloisomerase [Microbacterium sp. JB110]|uniref:6-phospho-3-hexuloisomerase n=1 Tax=Microbacterium sp. JB110 TaxID=2024477 RepID=UPI00097E82F7|nr:6-phospho-3-hexuloisomerase [Microbacterium sp. JB110]RCS62955.1 6-phospho-3-hexuloisomerase [Microbacterium sp. JB110]SJM61196.1 6-phospho-3-hexuloisomerase [Frigoribacterium sp. JB110]
MTTDTDALASALRLVSGEVAPLIGRVAAEANDDEIVTAVQNANRVFVLGAGRSGLALRMTAMRLMHLGLTVHVAGETTTPAIAEGDLLLTASGSGTTAGIVRAATTAKKVGAKIVALSTAAESPLAELADHLLVVPGAAKLDRSGDASAQYAGSLFEQAVVLVGDALFHALWQRDGRSADELWPSHANLE